MVLFLVMSHRMIRQANTRIYDFFVSVDTNGDRDPQGLVDALEFELIYAKTMSDMSEFKDSQLPKRMKLLNDSVIKMLEMFKAWEDGK